MMKTENRLWENQLKIENGKLKIKEDFLSKARKSNLLEIIPDNFILHSALIFVGRGLAPAETNG